MNANLCLPSFLDDDDLHAATAHMLSLECLYLWRRQRHLVERYGGGLHLAVDALLKRGVPDSPKLRHWCFVSKEIVRANTQGRDPHPYALSHIIIDSLDPDRMFLLHTLRLVEALLAAALDKRLPIEEFIKFDLGLVAAPSAWDLGRSGAFLAKGIGRPVSVCLDANGLTLDEGMPLVEHLTPGGMRLRIDARYQYAPPILLSGAVLSVAQDSGIFPLHLPIHERGLREPYIASAPVVYDPAVASGWTTILMRACELLRAADFELLGQCVRVVSEVLPLYHGLGQSFASASNPDVLGYVYLPAISTPLDVAECLVHEAMHQKLFRIESVVSLFAPDSPITDSFYSPWRKDSRPLNMVLHGCFVFTFVVHLWLRWSELQPNELSTKACAYRAAMQRAAEVLAGLQLLRKYARMTAIGLRFLDELEVTCRGLLSQIVVTDAVRADINASIEAHRQHHLEISQCSDPITF